jgi:hypothetical protein
MAFDIKLLHPPIEYHELLEVGYVTVLDTTLAAIA